MPSAPPTSSAQWCVLGRNGESEFAAVRVNHDGTLSGPTPIPDEQLTEFVASVEATESPRWVWHDTASLYPRLLSDGVRVDRCHDLRLCHLILRNSSYVADRSALLENSEWAVPPAPLDTAPAENAPTLFDLAAAPKLTPIPESLTQALAEFDRQRVAVASSHRSGRLSLLLAAESAGALIASELSAAGVPWDVAEHNRILSDALGPRPSGEAKPSELLAAGTRVREALGDPSAALDSPPKLLRALRSAGLDVSSTSRWELAEHEHPVIEPLLQYKKLARLLSANGWAWLDEWIREGRYRPVYVPGGVVTGRWASSGGGALQLPRQLRSALRADHGWKLVSADVSQLEPRVLAAMSGDLAMAAAGRGRDLYSGIVGTGPILTRQDAKLAMLGAMYGATSGDSGRLVPQLRRTFPAAMRLVDVAAATGERGETVTTWLGRSSPPAEQEWLRIQGAATMPGASRGDEDLARRSARDRGRFTRNFVVQGTAAEWALAWIADLRRRLARFPPVPADRSAASSGSAFALQPHLVFFLHDEVIVHSPAEYADEVAAAVSAAATAAASTLFGQGPVDFRLDLHVSERASAD